MLSVRRLLLTIIVLAGTAAGVRGADQFPPPVAVPDSEVYVVAIIPDLAATLTRAEQIGGLFSPAPVPAGSLAAALGGVLGDPGLTNLAKGPVVVVLGPGTPTPSVALLLPATDIQRYLDLASQKGFLMGKAVGSFAVVAQTPDGQAMGERIAAALPALPAVPPGTDLRVLTATSRLIKAYGPFLTGLVQMGTLNIPQQPGQLPLAKIAMLEVVGVFEVLGAIQDSQADISLAEKTISIDQRIAAVPDSALAKALVAPPAGPNRTAQRFAAVPGPVLAQFRGSMDNNALIDYLSTLAKVLLARPEAKDVIPDDAAAAVASMKEASRAFTGEWAMRVRTGTSAPMLLESVAGISDSGKAAQFYDAFFGLFTGEGAFAKIYQNMGMTMQLNKHLRTTGGLPVMSQNWTLDETKLPPQNLAMTKAMLHELQLAVGPDFVASANEPQTLDALVAGGGAGGGLVTKAEAAIGGGRQSYVDLDVPAFMRALVAAAKPPAAGAPPAPASDPLLAAITTGSGRQRIELRIPLAPFVGLGATLQAMQPPRLGRGQRPPAAQPAPNGGNSF